MEKRECSKEYMGAIQRKSHHKMQRRKQQIRLLAVGAPLILMTIIFSWNAFLPLLNSKDLDRLIEGDSYNHISPIQSENTIEPVEDGEFNSTPITEMIPDGQGKHIFASQNINDWNLVLVNPWNSVPEEYDITLTQLKDGHSVDERCYPDLQEMMDDCRNEGLSPLICSSYRKQETQESLYDNNVNSFLSQGYSEADAKIEAGKAVASPGTSEHQLGLAVDIVDTNNQNLDTTQEKTAVQQWLMQNSWKYGFILRYPSDKSQITGIIYEPWHYRYVGKENAEYIYENNICLEEYLELIS